MWLASVWRFDWVCDDAFITFRYARNLAEGHGLTYNPPERVEGYSNFLWTVWLALFERVGVEVTLAARASSIACGLGVLGLVARLGRRLGLGPAGLAAALGFLATLPPMAVWATSGLAAMPLACLLLLALERLVGDADHPRALQAGLAAAAAALVRADGPLGVTLVLGPALLFGLRDRRLLRAAALATAVAFAGFCFHLAWRYAYYGELAPNTARVKVDPSAITFERGAKYLATFALSFPAVLLALGLGLRRTGTVGALRWSAWAAVAGLALYSLFVGGDFMAMGRFLVPALPFAALLLACGLRGLDPRASWAAGLLAAALSLAGAFDVSVVPRAWREAAFFRWSAEGFRTEHEQWQMMRGQARRWSTLGRTLAAHTRPGESLVHGTIGAVGYYSRLAIHDPFGLVNREAFKPEAASDHGAANEPGRRSPGHHRRVPLATFMRYEPDYLDAELVPRAQPLAGFPRWLSGASEFADRAEPLLLPVPAEVDAPPGLALRLIRNRAGGAPRPEIGSGSRD